MPSYLQEGVERCPPGKIYGSLEKPLIAHTIARLVSGEGCHDSARKMLHCGRNRDQPYHCVSTYPANVEELNLYGIRTLQEAFPEIHIGYSGHEVGVATTLMAAVLGAASVERHITLDRAMWGSDQAASLEAPGLTKLVRDIRVWERARGDGNIRVGERELKVAAKLRRSTTLLDERERHKVPRRSAILTDSR